MEGVAHFPKDPRMEDSIAARLRQAREGKGLSQEALARLLNVSQKQVYRYESGEQAPPREMRARLAAVLGVSEPWIEHGIAPEARVVLDDQYEALPGDLERALGAYPELNDAYRNRLRRQRWDGGPPDVMTLMQRAASLLAIQRNKEAADNAPVTETVLPPGIKRMKIG
jgi:transcriptional regulator with XRE-family HTH domain